MLHKILMALSIAWICSMAQHDDGGGMGHGDHACEEETEKVRILDIADFNGSGIVTKTDIKMIRKMMRRGKYQAIMDLDLDGSLTHADVDLAKEELGMRSSAFDRQKAKVWLATKRYQNINKAIQDGFRPFTQELAGHGKHLLRMPVQFKTDQHDQVITSGPPAYLGEFDDEWENMVDESVEIRLPEGLNYDENGNLVAVFYYRGIDVADWVETNREAGLCRAGLITDPAACGEIAAHLQGLVLSAFGSVGLKINHETGMPMDMGVPHMDYFSETDGSEVWHQHFGACFDNFSYEIMQEDPTAVPLFDQMLTPSECNAQTISPNTGYLAAFNMLHLWVFKINRCGVFAGTDEEVSPHAEEEPFAHDRTRMEFFLSFLSGL